MFSQIFIAVTEVIAVFLLNGSNVERKKYGAIFGLAGEPFWFISSYKTGQYGAFFLCFVFTGIFINSIVRDFVKPHYKGKLPKLTNQQYYDDLIDSLEHIKAGDTRFDYFDKIKRVLREALLEPKSVTHDKVGQ